MPSSRASPCRDNLAQLGGWDVTGPLCHLPEDRNCGPTSTCPRNFFNLIWDTEARAPPQRIYRDTRQRKQAVSHGASSKAARAPPGRLLLQDTHRRHGASGEQKTIVLPRMGSGHTAGTES